MEDMQKSRKEALEGYIIQNLEEVYEVFGIGIENGWVT